MPLCAETEALLTVVRCGRSGAAAEFPERPGLVPIAESGASIEQSLFSAELASDRQSPEYLQLCAAAGAVG